MSEFLERPAESRKFPEEELYRNSQALLAEFLNNFGAILLSNQGAVPAACSASRGSEDSAESRGEDCQPTVVDTFTPDQVIHLLRTYILFFLNYKLKAEHSIREQLVHVVEEFVSWLAAEGYIEEDKQNLFDYFDERLVLGAARAMQVMINTCSSSIRKGEPEETRDSETAYLVSRVKNGRLWFVYQNEGRYEDFGPVKVPSGVTDYVKPGWSAECTFEKRDGRWSIAEIKELLPT